jgi:hypothetical protein
MKYLELMHAQDGPLKLAKGLETGAKIFDARGFSLKMFSGQLMME